MKREDDILAADRHAPIVRFCESFLERHGDCYLGVGWTKSQEQTDARYRVMLDVIREPTPTAVTLLDFGCGASHLYEYMRRHGVDHVRYSGLDLSDKFLALSRGKFPAVDYFKLNVLDPEDERRLPEFDYVVMNGVFTAKCELTFAEMLAYFQSVLNRVFAKARRGVAFNVMSKQVDWERDDLFHLPLDAAASFVVENLSRHFVIRHDYRLYEYTVYVYK